MTIFTNQETFYRQAVVFLNKISSLVEEYGIDLQSWSIDHICYRVGTNERYEKCKKKFLGFSNLLIESEVNGRLISTFKLYKPIQYNNRLINLIELPSPKQGKNYREGFEHIEVIAKDSFEKIISLYPNCIFDKTALSKDLNKELKIKLDHYQIKFHYQSLESIINLEKNDRIYMALKNSKVLELLKESNPLVAGTFPLGIFQQESDLDIIASTPSLDDFRDKIRKYFASKDKFIDKMCEVGGEKSYIAFFEENRVPIEIFAQTTFSVKQVAYQHFQIEEQLLKVGSEKFLRAIRQMREDGLKTEPAFAKVLNLSGDPFDALLKLNNKSDQDIYQLLSNISAEFV